MTWVLNVEVDGKARPTVQRSSEDAIWVAFSNELGRLGRDYVRTGGRPKPGTLATAHLRARDRRRKSKATITLAQR